MQDLGLFYVVNNGGRVKKGRSPGVRRCKGRYIFQEMRDGSLSGHGTHSEKQGFVQGCDGKETDIQDRIG